jgi:rod shape-determining protein MreD
MRWIPFLILAYLVVLLQTTLGRLLTFTASGMGSIGPDLTALVAVFVALHARSWPDAMMAAWTLGLAVDLTAAGGVGASTVVGPMSLAYALTAGLLFRVREAFFRERAMTQALLALAFCLVAHFVWVSMQSLLAPGGVTASAFGHALLQVLALACYSALLTPLVHFLLGKCGRWFLVSPVGIGGGRRR